MRNTMKILRPLYFVLIVATLHACTSPGSEEPTSFSSADTAKLAQIIDIRTFKPTKVNFKYTYIANAGNNQRFGVPGPSYSRLEAVMDFDAATFDKIITGYKSATYTSPNLDKKDFAFDWLDADVKNALDKTDSTYKGSPDFLFGSDKNGGLWLLDKKILLIKFSN
jgi:hypothetical protein